MTKRENLPDQVSAVPYGKSNTQPRDLALCSIKEARERVSYSDALRWKVLPLSLMKVRGVQVLTLAGERRRDPEVEQALKFLTDCSISVIPADPKALADAIFYAYRGEVEGIEALMGSLGGGAPEAPEKLLETLSQEQSIPGLVARLLEYALSKGASDLTLLPQVDGRCSCQQRIDGTLSSVPINGYSMQIHSKIINRVKVLGNVSSDSAWIPLDGSFRLPLPTGTKDIRFHIFPTVHGLKLNFRLPVHPGIPALSELGLSAKTRMFLETVLERTDGGVVLVGPTGSGKTTTAYSALSAKNSGDNSIVSLEDPVEREISGVSQTDISLMHGMSYAEGIRHVLRQDPDVIFIGEVRDHDSAVGALEAAATGHLLITAAHGAGVFEALSRLRRLSGDSQFVADGLSLLIAQRLLPRLCSVCKVIDLAGSRAVKGAVHQATGCSRCDYTGYQGRVLIDESLFLTEGLKEQLRRGELTKERVLGKPYFQYLEDSLQTAILDGVVDLKSAKKIVPPR